MYVEIPQDHLDEFEKKNVHQVYQAIAPHFSATRYKPWPVVDTFLKSMPGGSIGADVGCGNGKYLNVNPNIFTVGSDRCEGLIEICAKKGCEAMVCDACELPYKSSSFDFVISIAVIHHFSSPERRLAAINELLRIAKKGSRLLIFVWALEQTKDSKRKFDAQDVFVSWNIPKNIQEAVKLKAAASETTTTSTSFLTSTSSSADNAPEVELTPPGDLVYKRYYHLFKQGELDELVSRSNTAKILESGYDRDNWYIIAEKLE